MNIQLSELKKLNSFLSLLFPRLGFDRKELNRENSEKLVCYVVYGIDALLKGENFHKKRNLILPEGENFFPENVIEVMENINFYLSRFDTKIFTFSKTERQTFIFIIENIIDYFKKTSVNIEDKNDNLFIDNRFWIDNFFKIFNQKINGSVYLSKKVDSKRLFHSPDSSKNELIYIGSSLSFSISPFIIYK